MYRKSNLEMNGLKALFASCKSIQQALQIHAHMVVTGQHHDLFLFTRLISFFVTTSLHHSHLLFSQITNPDLFLFNAMIRAFSLSHTPQYAFFLYKSMLSKSPPIFPDAFTFPYLLKSCAKLSRPKHGLQVHCHVIKSGFELDIFVVNALLHYYFVFGDTNNACKVFEQSPVRDCVSYNTMINGLVHVGRPRCSLRAFGEMRGFCVEPDEYTLVSLLSACSLLEDHRSGKQVHGLVYRKLGCLGDNDLLMNAVVDMYAKCGRLQVAERVLSRVGLGSGKDGVEAWTSLVSAYALRGEVEVARRLFDQMGERDVISWTAMINGYSHAGCFQEALELFVQFEGLGMKPDKFAVVAALSACAQLGALEMGRRIHHKYGGENLQRGQHEGFICAVVDMYAKCGSIDTALDIFCKTSDDLKTTFLYNCIISGLAHHGFAGNAMALFEEMGLLGLRPNEITFVKLLSACGHSGLVDDGKRLFESMLTGHGITPQMEHYGCMVDLLGRAGRLNEAYNFILNMPFKANAVIWRALLSACKVHGDVELAKLANQELLVMEHDHGARYVMLSNMLTDMDQHEEAASVRKAIDDGGIQKPPGWSYVEMNGALHKFLAGDKSHPEAKATELMLRDVNVGVNSIGHVISASKTAFDID
ncbi:pentatricopeptide repeat-containing protein At2g22410, mitochondrial-like [Abrus precatorius]|uniref:Pentatricopeptide repeat-containing protein At2g22410, mitochondrial-like n=1 Tax=Abrus precatorius TaxID=3816 RepID=A0A8B8MGX8_ABRPR|nr:pentatricopeptide repeat-containing protein At2g22410, mitochondrial-like [Abrus precatorius]